MLKQAMRYQVRLVAALRAAREAAGLDQVQASLLIGGSRTLVAKIESFQRTVKAAELPVIAKAYKKDPVDLLKAML